MPENITEISNGLFKNCKSLTECLIPEGVIKLGDESFSWCHSLNAIVLPDSLQFIGEKAFYEAYGISNIIIPNNVTQIGKEAFFALSFEKIVFDTITTDDGKGASIRGFYLYSANITVYAPHNKQYYGAPKNDPIEESHVLEHIPDESIESNSYFGAKEWIVR